MNFCYFGHSLYFSRMYSLLNPWHGPFSLLPAGTELFLWICPSCYTPPTKRKYLSSGSSFKHPRGKHSKASLHQFFLEQWIFPTISSQAVWPRDSLTSTLAAAQSRASLETHWSLCQTQHHRWGQHPYLVSPGELFLLTLFTGEYDTLPTPDPAILCLGRSFPLQLFFTEVYWDNTNIVQIWVATPSKVLFTSLPVTPW